MMMPKKYEHFREAIGQMLADNRPRAWIRRELGVPPVAVRVVARDLGYSPRARTWMGSLEDYDALERAVQEGWPLNEITRTFGYDYRTTKRWFPDAGWDVGGGNLVREGNRRRAEHRRKTRQTRDIVPRMGFGQYKANSGDDR